MSATSAVQRIEAFMQSDTRANMTGILRYCIEQGCARSMIMESSYAGRLAQREYNAMLRQTDRLL
jgi:hypothetical protein